MIGAYHRWLRQGIDNGWCSEPFCTTHDIAPGYDYDGDGDSDECIAAVRLQDSGR